MSLHCSSASSDACCLPVPSGAVKAARYGTSGVARQITPEPSTLPICYICHSRELLTSIGCGRASGSAVPTWHFRYLGVS
jgi:hypothetical protein